MHSEHWTSRYFYYAVTTDFWHLLVKTSGKSVLRVECLGGTDISGFWTKCMCKVKIHISHEKAITYCWLGGGEDQQLTKVLIVDHWSSQRCLLIDSPPINNQQNVDHQSLILSPRPLQISTFLIFNIRIIIIIVRIKLR